MFETSKWIWHNEAPVGDEYGEFYAQFFHELKKEAVVCKISADTDYALYLNGKLVSCNQYADFEWYKVYDEINISDYLVEGINHFAVVVYHCGHPTQRYRPAQAGVIFEVSCGNELILKSGQEIFARRSLAYRNGKKKKISNQLGFSFLYDSQNEDGWMSGEGRGFSPATVVEKDCSFYPRPIKRSQILPPCGVDVLRKEGSYLIDLGRETVGLLYLSVRSPANNKITVAYGERLVNGCVPRIIGHRDFSVEYVAREGKNEYLNPFLRLACRYLEVFSELPIEIEYVGIRPQVYPTKEKEFLPFDKEDKRIYDLCAQTLNLCMMEHYVDCPWREQGLYVFDSRNQMLCGYYAFDDGNFEYAKANLLLMSQDRREDDLLSICFPCGADLTIPSFSLYYFMAVEEYLTYSKDISLLEEVWEKLQAIMKVFIGQLKDGLVYTLAGVNHWNYYDWSDGLEGELGKDEPSHPDLILNCLLLLALKSLKRLSAIKRELFVYDEVIVSLSQIIKERFYCKENGLFVLSDDKSLYTELGNALAILAGLTTESQTQAIAEKIKNKRLSACSLSMKVFVYEALLVADNKNIDYVLAEIRRVYGNMLAQGATSVWETENGAEDFGGSGSLCHGWSAIPVYFFHKQKQLLI